MNTDIQNEQITPQNEMNMDLAPVPEHFAEPMAVPLTTGEVHTEPHEAAHGGHEGVEVKLAAEQLGTIFGIPMTNTLLTSLIVAVCLMGFSFWFSRKVTLVPGRLQAFFESIILYVQGFVEETLEDAALARKYFPLLMTSFLFIALCNLAEFIPGIHSVQFLNNAGEYVPFLRGTNTDLNMTLALTLVVVFMIEAAGIMALGVKHYAQKFFTLESPIKFFVGIVEFVSELARVISFSFRLFGNIFAGQVLIAVVTFFVPYVLPAPLMMFEMFVGVVQAAIFTLLTLFFIKLAVSEPH